MRKVLLPRRSLNVIIALFVFSCILGINAVWAMHPGATDIMLQAFHWQAKNNGQHGAWYDLIASKAEDIQETGITIVWFPPVSKTSRWDLSEEGDPYSACGYVPMDYYDLGEYKQWVQDGWPHYSGNWYQHSGTETLYGSRAELENAITALHGKGIQVIADIVLNHRGPRQKNVCDEWISWGDDVGQIASGKMFWGHKNDCDPLEIWTGNGGSGSDDGESTFGPNINHQSSQVQNQFKEWVSWMKYTIGFDGWRYDYVKGLSGNHIKEYNDHTNPHWSVGEFWDSDTNKIIAWIDATHTDHAKKSTAFDFPTKFVLTDNFGNNNFAAISSLPGLMGRWSEKAVTFLDNHDTHPPHENPHQFPDNRLLEGYAYILTHPGAPCIYWQHFYDKGTSIHDRIKELAQIRKEQGITNTSSVTILRAEQGLYAAHIDGKLVVKLGPNRWEPGDAGLSGYTTRVAFGDYKIWTKSGSGTAVTTTFRIHKDVGFGNYISIRGSIPHLNNWGVPGKACTWTTGNVWECAVSDIPEGQTFEWKSLKNDSLWESGANHSGKGGDTLNIVPSGY